MSEPRKAKNARTGEEVILYQHTDGSWKRTAPAAPAGPPKKFDQQPASPWVGAAEGAAQGLQNLDDKASDLLHSVMRTDVTDKIGAGIASALPLPGGDNRIHAEGSGYPSMARDMQQDMRLREGRSAALTGMGDTAQVLAPAAIQAVTGIPLAPMAATLPARMSLGAVEGGAQAMATAGGAAAPGEQNAGDVAASGAFGAGIGAGIPALLGGLQGAGQGLYSMAKGDPLIKRAFAGGAEPAALSRAGIKPSPLMDRVAGEAGAIKPGAAGAEKAYGDLADLVLPKIAADVGGTLKGAEAATDAAVGNYPNLRMDTMPLRNEINNALSRMVGDITPESSIAGINAATRIKGAEPFTDLASQGPESDLAKSGAEEFRQMARQLLRSLPPDESTVVGHALRGSGAERKLATIGHPDPEGLGQALFGNGPTPPTKLPDLTDDLVDEGATQTHRTAQFTVQELVNQKRLIDQAGRQAQSLNQPENVRRYRALGDVIRKMLGDGAPDVAKVAQAEHEAFNQMEARLTQLGLPPGTRDIDVTHGSVHWQALHNKLVQDPLTLREALKHLGPEASQGARQASGTLATEQLRGHPDIGNFLKGAEAATWKNPEAGMLSALRGLHPVRRGAAMKNLPNDSPSIRRSAIVGLVPTFQEGDK